MHTHHVCIFPCTTAGRGVPWAQGQGGGKRLTTGRALSGAELLGLDILRPADLLTPAASNRQLGVGIHGLGLALDRPSCGIRIECGSTCEVVPVILLCC